MVVTPTSSEFISVGNYRYVGENEYDKKPIGNVCNLLQSILRKIKKASKFKKTLIVFLLIFLALVPRSWFCWGYSVHMQLSGFANIFLFFKILSPNSFGKLWDTSYIRFFILDTRFRFICGEWNVYYKTFSLY